MHDHGTEAATQRAVLSLALDAHPQSLTISDLAPQFGREATEAAVAALVADGLFIRDGDVISPSAAAVHFDALELP